MRQNRRPTSVRGNVEKSPSSPVLSHAEGKAANSLLGPAGPHRCLTRGAYIKYVSTAQWRPACAKRFGEGRERRWRLFSTFPFSCKFLSGAPRSVEGEALSTPLPFLSPLSVFSDPCALLWIRPTLSLSQNSPFHCDL